MNNTSKIVRNALLSVAAALLPLQAAIAQNADSSGSDLIRGVVEPLDRAVLSAEIVAKITKMPFRDGMNFSKGDVLIEFDCARLHAELAATEAAKTAAQQVYDGNRELSRFDAIGDHEVLQSKADLERTTAEWQARKVVVKQCVLRAPYSGRVVTTHVNPHETSTQGNPLIDIIDDSEFELALIVPSTWLSWLRPGAEFQFRVDETGESHAASIKQIGAAVDPVSQTVTVTGRFAQRPDWVLAGMSGSAEFTRGEEQVSMRSEP